MKYFLILLSVASFACLNSCVKKIDVIHDIHDTVFISPLKTDTFSRVTIHTDTVIKNDNHIDTVIQVRHDTLILYKTTSDTLFKYYLDTVFLTKTLHDTVTKSVYMFDTVNNIQVITLHDTIIRINTVVTVDTVYTYSNSTNYPVPARDSGQIYITFDTIPGFVLTDIQITNLLSYIPGTLTDQTPAQYTQVSDYVPINYPNYGWMIHPVGPMICNIVFYYSWTVPNNITTTLQTFDYSHSWSTLPLNPTGGADGTVHVSKAVFNYIDLTKIFFITIKNH